MLCNLFQIATEMKISDQKAELKMSVDCVAIEKHDNVCYVESNIDFSIIIIIIIII